MVNVELLTKDDLEQFRMSLIKEIRSLLVELPATRQTWFRSKEVRKMLGISAGTLQNLRVAGKLEYSKVGGTFYYKKADIERLLQNGRYVG